MAKELFHLSVVKCQELLSSFEIGTNGFGISHKSEKDYKRTFQVSFETFENDVKIFQSLKYRSPFLKNYASGFPETE